MKTISGRRGDLKFLIESPMGTKSMILGTRSHDQSNKGFDKYEFLTMELWDEKAIGLWNFHAIAVRAGCSLPKIDGLDIRIRGTGNDQYSSLVTPKPTTTSTTTTTTVTTTSKASKATTKSEPKTEKKMTTKSKANDKIETANPTKQDKADEAIQKIETELIPESQSKIDNETHRAGTHSGLVQLVLYLFVGCGLLYFLSNWYMKRGGANSSPGKTQKPYKYERLNT